MKGLSKRMGRLFFAAGLLLLLTSQAALGLDGVWTGFAGNGVWSDSGNWFNGDVPLSSLDNATIPGTAAPYPVIQNESVFLNNLTIENGGDVAVGDLASVELFGLLTVNTGGKMTISGNSASAFISSADISGLFVVTPGLPTPEAVVTLASTFSIGSGGTFQLDSGGRVIISPGSASLFVNGGGIFQMNGGTVNVENNAGGLEIAPTGVLQMEGGTIGLGTTVPPVSPGKFTWNGDFQMNAGLVQVSPISEINSNGTLVWTGGEIGCSDSGVGFPWLNSGTIEISPGGSPILSNCDFTNDSTLTFLSGASLLVTDLSTGGVTKFVNGINGTIQGDGVIEFLPSTPWTDNIRLVNNGTLSPGGGGAGTIGGISILGDFENTGILEFDISTTSNDELTVNAGSGSSGSVTLNGELIVNHIAGTYSGGQTFPVISYQLQSGTFTTFTPTPPPGFTFDPIDYGPGSSSGAVTLTLQSTGPKEWDGSESDDWFNAQNWVNDAPPSEGDDILIPVVTSPAVYPTYPDSGAFVAYGEVTVQGEMTIATGAGFGAAFQIADGGKLNNSGDLHFSAGSTNAGTLSWTGGIIVLDEGTAFTNAASGRIECDNGTAGTDLVLIGNPLSEFTNAGDFIKTGIGGAVIEVEAFNQDGVVEVSGGKLTLKPSVSGGYAGEFRLANDAELILGKGVHEFAESNVPPIGARHIAGQGRFLIGDPNLTDPAEFPTVSIYNDLVLDPGVSVEIFSGQTMIGSTPGGTPQTITGGGRLVLDDATSGAIPPTMYLNSDLTIEGPLHIAGGGINGEGDLFVNGPFEWTGGLLAGFGMNGVPKIVLESGATIDNSHIGTLDGTGSTLRLEGRDLILLGGATVYDGRLEFGIAAKMEIGDSGGTGSPAVLNVRNDPATGMIFAASDANAGFGYGVFNYATIAGSGRLAFSPSISTSFPAPDFGNYGVIAPGNGTPGALLFDVENYDHLDGELQVNLLGTASGEWDRMEVTGPVYLGGVLAVDLGFIPQQGDEFVVMTHGGVMSTGQFFDTFLKIGGVEQPFAEYFDIFYDANQVRLQYIAQTSLATLSVSVSPGSSAGSVTMSVADGTETGQTFTCPDQCSITVPMGSGVSLSASASAGYSFSGWQGADSVSDTSAFVEMISDRQVTASFLQPAPPPPDDTPVTPDNCPDDPLKTEPGICGCGVPDIDTDGDETYDCNDGCPEDPDKTAAGVCGCGTPDTDSDQDGTPDCNDGCHDDPGKTEPGVCGCGNPETDSDQDGTPDCVDDCPDDPTKTAPGVCGCGTPDTDADDDGTPDCVDECPQDALKVEPGICGCGIPELDSDGDGVLDCIDLCPGDPGKTEPGACGCGVSDADDRDDDGTPDCTDFCPDDPRKIGPGACGCGIADIDENGDGTPDCIDADSPFVLGEPRPIFPENGAYLEADNVFLEGLVFYGAGAGGGLETHWWVRRADNPTAFLNYRQITYGGFARYRFKDAIPGMRYSWRFGYRHPETGGMVWSEMQTFTVGLPEEQTGKAIPPGSALRDYRMRTFPFWTVAPSFQSLLREDGIVYDTHFFRAGGWDSEACRYLEFSDSLEMVLGRSFWFLSRDGYAPMFSGVPVSLSADICAPLGFDEGRSCGWNQIASPNNADYFWDDVQVVAYAPTDDPEEFVRTFGPVPLSELDPENPYLSLSLWHFNAEGGYDEFQPGGDGAVLLREEGYWVEARRDNVCLIFPAAAQQDFTSEETLVVRALREARRLARTHLTPDEATAQSGESPPMPMGELDAYTASDPSTRVDGGGGGCFIEAVSDR